MHGRQVRAPSIAFDFQYFDSMWNKGGHECLADDTVTYWRQGKDVGLEVTAGRPKCSDLTEEDVITWARHKRLCVTTCGEYCSKAQKKLRKRLSVVSQISVVTLTPTQEKNDR